ncbi:MAG: hypothetical protein NC548_31085 [Lachnospiraceae bacterium]|nr:hypothetical protein [Lachnospiraceae bacterium]MCM1232061.1 hypothetical protein [Ruminococcus flavefaciens]
MAQNWSAHCNTDAYGQDGGFEENREELEFKSGRKIFYNKNSKPKMTHALNFRFDDKAKIGGKTEFEWFLYWYEVTMRGGSESFYFDDIITHMGKREYLLANPPTWTGQRTKEVSVTFTEK